MMNEKELREQIAKDIEDHVDFPIDEFESGYIAGLNTAARIVRGNAGFQTTTDPQDFIDFWESN